MALMIRYFGDPILRQKASPITEITPEVRQVVADMQATLKAHPGWGLAAPQVGHPIRLFLSWVPDCRVATEYDVEASFDPSQIRVYINPKLINPSNEICTYVEGCMSLPDIFPPVTRPIGITVEAMDLEGNTFTRDLWGFQARVIMHENDHLNGVLHIDRTPPRDRKLLEPQLRALKKQEKR